MAISFSPPKLSPTVSAHTEGFSLGDACRDRFRASKPHQKKGFGYAKRATLAFLGVNTMHGVSPTGRRGWMHELRLESGFERAKFAWRGLFGAQSAQDFEFSVGKTQLERDFERAKRG